MLLTLHFMLCCFSIPLLCPIGEDNDGENAVAIALFQMALCVLKIFATEDRIWHHSLSINTSEGRIG
jgi:hypothetical protein